MADHARNRSAFHCRLRALAFFLLYWLLRHVKVTTVTSMGLVHPVVAVFAGWVVLNETLGWTVMLGTGVVLSGLALILVWPSGKRTQGALSTSGP